MMKKIFKTPIIIALLTLIGLASALIGDDLFDWASWGFLTVPLVMILRAVLAAK